MAGPSNTIKPEKLVNADIDVIAEVLGTLHFDESWSPNSQGIFDWDMVDLVDNLERVIPLIPNPLRAWLVLNLNNVLL